MIHTPESLRRMAMRTGARVEIDGLSFNAGRAVGPYRPPAPEEPAKPAQPPPPDLKLIEAEVRAHQLAAKVSALAARVAVLEQEGEAEPRPQAELKVIRDSKGLIKYIVSTSGRKWKVVRDSNDRFLRLVPVGGSS